MPTHKSNSVNVLEAAGHLVPTIHDSLRLGRQIRAISGKDRAS
jgi:hypothetical protein